MSRTIAKAAASSCADYDPPVLTTSEWAYVHDRLSDIPEPLSYQLMAVFGELGVSTDRYSPAVRHWKQKHLKTHKKRQTKKPRIPVPDVVCMNSSSLVHALSHGKIAAAHQAISNAKWPMELGYSGVYYPKKRGIVCGGRKNHIITSFVARRNTGVLIHLFNKMAKLIREKTIPRADHLGITKMPTSGIENLRLKSAYHRYMSAVSGRAHA